MINLGGKTSIDVGPGVSLYILIFQFDSSLVAVETVVEKNRTIDSNGIHEFKT